MYEAENVLLRRFVASGDSEAFAEIVHRHAGLVYGACLRILEDRDKAADAVQETFFQLLRNAGSITGSVPCWLHRVATRRAIDRIRKDSTRRQREIRYAAQTSQEIRQWEDISPYVDEELTGLDQQTRQILIQHFFEGRTTRDIGSSMRVSQATISRRIEAGVARLRERLRRRGIIVAAATLSGLLGENAAEAAPALVMKELGKMALVGSQAVAASAAGSATAAAGAGAKAAASGAVAGIKVKVITAAAVAAVGVGSVATLHYTSGPSDESPGQTVVGDFDDGAPRSTPLTRRQQRSGDRAPLIRQAPEMSFAESGPQGYPGMTNPQSDEGMFGMMAGEATAGAQETEPAVPGGYGMAGGMGGMAMGATRESGGTVEPQEDSGPPQGAFFGFGGMAVTRTQPPDDPNDSNDRSSED